MLTFHYRENQPSWMSTRKCWGLNTPQPKEPDPSEITRVDAVRALRAAESLHAEVDSSADESCSPHAVASSDSDAVASASPITITVGTDCSGMDVPILALRNLGVNYRHVFSSDIDLQSKQFIMKNYPPEQFFDDIRLRDNRVLQKDMDIYVAGFPCQPFSVAGYQNGLDDPRGKIINHVLHHIDHNQPKLFVVRT